MASFIQLDYPSQHPGVERAERVAQGFKQATREFDGARGAASLLLAAVVAALLVVANQVVDTWSEGHLLAAWIVMWTVGFAGLALFATPARRAGVVLRNAAVRWAAERRQAAEDQKLWDVALRDARVMADLSRAMSQGALRDVKQYY